MRLRRRGQGILLVLIPALLLISPLASNLVVPHEQIHTPVRREALPPAATSSRPLEAAPPVKFDGNRDAPVDGLDGKPKSGPWIETSADKNRKMPSGASADSAPDSHKPAPAPLKDAAINRLAEEGYGDIPQTNGGVMDDPHRVAPKEGTRGTEGGVSEKERDRKAQEGEMGERMEKKPDPPKEAPPLPHSEQERMGAQKEAGRKTRESGEEASDGDELHRAMGLEKPADPLDKPKDNTVLPPPASQKSNPSTDTHNDVAAHGPADEPETGIIRPFHSFILSLTMILFSEIGDKTFLVAALMAMRHPRLLVFSAAYTALIAMTVLSAVLGHAVPSLIPSRATHFLAALLFLVFGARMLRDGYAMDPADGVGAEMKEVEMELEEKEYAARRHRQHHHPSARHTSAFSNASPYALEAGRAGFPPPPRRSRSPSRTLPSIPRSPSSSPSRSRSPSSPSSSSSARFRFASLSRAAAGINNLCSLILSPAWVQTFVMTFLGEWGDRSQIATIAMAAGQDWWWVTGGAVVGHAVCTAGAVVGGRAVAGRVSMRVVTLGGAVAFLVFGVLYLVEAAYEGG